MPINFNDYNPVKMNDDKLYYYFDKINVNTQLEGDNYDFIDNKINEDSKDNNEERKKINEEREKLIKDLTKKKINFKNYLDNYLSNQSYNFRIVNVNNDEDYKKFLLEKTLYESLKNDGNNYINKHYFRTEKENQYLYNITDDTNYKKILKEIDDKLKVINTVEYIVLNEVQFVYYDNVADNFDIENKPIVQNILKLTNNITKCYLFDKIIDGRADIVIEERCKAYIETVINSELVNKINNILYSNSEKKIELSEDFRNKLIDEIMKKYQNGKIEHFIGIYDFIKDYNPIIPEDIKLDNIAYLIAANQQLNTDERPISDLQTGGSSFPRIASLLAASQINMPPLLSPISSFYEKYIKYKSKYLKLQKIKSLKY